MKLNFSLSLSLSWESYSSFYGLVSYRPLFTFGIISLHIRRVEYFSYFSLSEIILFEQRFSLNPRNTNS